MQSILEVSLKALMPARFFSQAVQHLSRVERFYRQRVAELTELASSGTCLNAKVQVFEAERYFFTKLGYSVLSCSTVDSINVVIPLRTAVALQLARELLQKCSAKQTEDLLCEVDSGFLLGVLELGIDDTTFKRRLEKIDLLDFVSSRSCDALLRPVVLLELLQAQPSLYGKLVPSAAAHPERLFRTPSVKLTIAEVEQSLGESFLNQLDESFVELMQEIASYVVLQPPARFKRKNLRGSFELNSKRHRADWTFSPEDSATLAKLEEFLSLHKKAILAALSEFIILERRVYLEHFGTLKKLESASRSLRIGKLRRLAIATLLDRYAANQVAHIWQTTGEVVRTTLAKQRGYTAQVLSNDDQALLELRAGSGRSERIHCFRKDSNLRNTTSSLALAAAVLNELLVRAKQLVASN